MYNVFDDTISSGLSEEKFETVSFTRLLKERSRHEKFVSFSYGQLVGTVEDNKCTANNSRAVKSYPSKLNCSALFSCGLTDSASVAVCSFSKEVGSQHRSSKDELKPFSFTGFLKERCSPEMLVTFSYGQLAGNDSESKRTEAIQ